jgi:hypothetical protein
MASERDAEFAAEVPAFVDEIRRIFTPEEIRAYLDGWPLRTAPISTRSVTPRA